MAAEAMPLQHQQITTVHLSDKERTLGSLTDENLGIAVSAIHRDGIVVLENAVPAEHCDTLNNILMREAESMAKLPTTHFNENSIDGKSTGNMSQGPPLDPALMYTSIWANQPAAHVLSYVLGPNPRVNFVNGNTALGGFNGARQRVHADLSFNHARLPWGIVTNYYLMDVSPANGSTEIWLASHQGSFADHRNCFVDDVDEDSSEEAKIAVFGIKEELYEARRKWAPPIQPVVKKGSVILRDLKLWHAGLCNPSPDPRIMLAFVHTSSWYHCPTKVVLPESARELISCLS
ncbi:phytanoyl-CoA dioxygenase family protein [Rhizodiscina lignyota]|uniref:Phytanoyl-CoA dioxygenase family protein n=1 Tax=Rhizodiscina lignyota TaxID=1504668 RepID=A0A9P4I6D1_9PEZI|nr:phytanoyl-CoA dioxygenase family protein [Rhizodiscina lignyota]